MEMNEKQKRVERYWGKTPKEFKGYGDIDPVSIRVFDNSHPAIAGSWLKNDPTNY